MIQLYAGKCFDTQKAERYFKERRIPYQRVDVLRFGMGRRELESVRAAVGLQAMIDREGKAFRESPFRFSDDEALLFAHLCERPQLLRLPIVRDGRRATVGYCPDVWESWLKKQNE